PRARQVLLHGLLEADGAPAADDLLRHAARREQSDQEQCGGAAHQSSSSRSLSRNVLRRGLTSSPESSAKRSISLRCSELSRVGTSTNTRTSWSPRPLAPKRDRPAPRSRITSPDCVPPGIEIFVLPSSEGTSTSAPSVACAIDTGSSQTRSLPSRSNSG